MLAGNECARRAASEASFSKIVEFIVQIYLLLNSFVEGKSEYCFILHSFLNFGYA